MSRLIIAPDVETRPFTVNSLLDKWKSKRSASESEAPADIETALEGSTWKSQRMISPAAPSDTDDRSDGILYAGKASPFSASSTFGYNPTVSLSLVYELPATDEMSSRDIDAPASTCSQAPSTRVNDFGSGYNRTCASAGSSLSLSSHSLASTGIGSAGLTHADRELRNHYPADILSRLQTSGVNSPITSPMKTTAGPESTWNCTSPVSFPNNRAYDTFASPSTLTMSATAGPEYSWRLPSQNGK